MCKLKGQCSVMVYMAGACTLAREEGYMGVQVHAGGVEVQCLVSGQCYWLNQMECYGGGGQGYSEAVHRMGVYGLGKHTDKEVHLGEKANRVG